MSTERHAEIGNLFWDAVQLAGEERERFLADLEARDADLHDEVIALILVDEESTSPLARTHEGIGVSVLADAMDVERIGPYRIVRRIGEGGMGRVYEAVQEQPARRVALKIMRPGRDSVELVRRFEREITLLGRLEHPGIVRAYDAGSFDAGDGQQPFLVMEYAEGRPFAAAAADMTRTERLELLLRVTDAIAHAHQRGVIHRDLKPDNVIVTDDGQPRVLDFGVARATSFNETLTSLTRMPGQIIGTLSYMSPEQCLRDRAVDHRADVYALGVMLFELLSGQLPHDLAGRPLAEALRVRIEDDAATLRTTAAGLRGDLDVITATALARDPRRRYATVRAFAGDLRRHLADEPIHARRPSPAYRLVKFARRNVALVASIAVIGLTLASATVVSTRYSLQAQRDRDTAERAADASERSVYRLAIGQAQSAIEGRDGALVERSLELAPVPLRGWEWRHLDARRDPMIVLDDELRILSTTSVGFRAGHPRIVADAADGARVLDGITAREVGRFPGASAHHVAIAADGRRFAEVSADGSALRIGDLDDDATAPRSVSLPADSGEPRFLRFASAAPDRLLVAAERATLLIDLAGGGVVGRWPVATSAAPSPDGTSVLASITDHRLVPAPSDDATAPGRRLVLWTPDHPERRLPGRPWFKDRSESLAFSPSGDRVALTVASLVVRVIDLPADVVRYEGWSVDYRRGWGLAFLGEDRLVIPGGDLSARIIDFDGHELDRLPIRTSRSQGDDRIHAIATTPEGDAIFLASDVGASFHPMDRSSGLQLAGHTRYVYCAAWSPDGDMLATAGWDHSVRLWCGFTGAAIAVLPIDGRETCVASLAFSADGRRLMATVPPRYRWETTPMHRRIWDLVTGEVVDDTPGIFEVLVDSPGDTTFAGTSPMDKSKIASSGACAVVTHDGRHVIGAIRGNEALLYDLETGEERPVPGAHRPTLAVSPDGRELVFAAYRSPRIERRSLPDLSLIGTLETDHVGEIFSIAWSPDGERLVTAGRDRLIRIWEPETGELMAVLDVHADYVHDVVFSPDGTRLASVSGDGTARIWDTVPRHVRLEQEAESTASVARISAWAARQPNVRTTDRRTESSPQTGIIEPERGWHVGDGVAETEWGIDEQ
ncbi:MAG: protein kinase [Phycisphaerales bacterium]